MQELGLVEAPPVVVTAEAKDVAATCRQLQLPAATALLFDDNTKLSGEKQVVIVDKMENMPAERRVPLLRWLQREMPAHELDADTLDFLEESPPHTRVVTRDANGRVSWRIPEATRDSSLSPWPTPDPPIASTYATMPPRPVLTLLTAPGGSSLSSRVSPLIDKVFSEASETCSEISDY
jgi:hypothetical protein